MYTGEAVLEALSCFFFAPSITAARLFSNFADNLRLSELCVNQNQVFCRALFEILFFIIIIILLINYFF